MPLDALEANRIEGSVCTSYSHSDADPRDVWLSVVYESEDAYGAVAKSLNQDMLHMRCARSSGPTRNGATARRHHAVPATS